MIKNIFYVLTIAGAAATAYFATVTKSKLSEAIDGTVQRFNDNNTVAGNIEKKEEEIKVAKTEKDTAVTARNDTDSELENEAGKQNGLEKSLATFEAEVEELDVELERIDGAITEAKVVIAQLIPNSGGDLDIDDVVGHIEDLENRRKEMEIELEEKTEISGTLAKRVNADENRKEGLQTRLGKVKNRIALNGVSASVSGVSNDYGFVVINRGGNNSNISESSRFLVSRGGKLIARLKVAQVEPTQTICDIIPKSIKRGQRIRSGDRVTFEEPAGS